jgi:hypothetical protein
MDIKFEFVFNRIFKLNINSPYFVSIWEHVVHDGNRKKK